MILPYWVVFVAAVVCMAGGFISARLARIDGSAGQPDVLRDWSEDIFA